jgi:hypothetical protein
MNNLPAWRRRSTTRKLEAVIWGTGSPGTVQTMFEFIDLDKILVSPEHLLGFHIVLHRDHGQTSRETRGHGTGASRETLRLLLSIDWPEAWIAA